MRTSSIRLRANARLAILHEDYLEICDGNMLAAMLLSILVYWTDVKIAKKDENLWVWKSHQDFQEDLMFDKPGMKPPHRTTIKTAIDLLLKKKYVEWRRNPKMPLDQTRQYLVHTKAIQSAIDKLPPIVVKPTMQSQNSDNGMSENQQSLSENRQCNVEIPTSNTNDYSTEITVSETTGNVVATSAEDRNAPASDNLIDFEERKTASGKHKAIPKDVVSSHSQRLSEDDDVPTVKMAAVKIGDTNGRNRNTPGEPHDYAHNLGVSDTQGTPRNQNRTSPAQQQTPPGPPIDAAQAVSTPPASDGATSASGAVQASSKRKGKKVTQAKPAITLTAQEQAFWELWCSVWFNQDVPPTLNETAYGHVKTLAPHITTSEQLNSLIDYTRKDLAASQNIKRKMVQLGNMVYCYPGWKQSQQEPARKNGKAPGKPDAYGNDYSLTSLIARQQKAM